MSETTGGATPRCWQCRAPTDGVAPMCMACGAEQYDASAREAPEGTADRKVRQVREHTPGWRPMDPQPAPRFPVVRDLDLASLPSAAPVVGEMAQQPGEVCMTCGHTRAFHRALTGCEFRVYQPGQKFCPCVAFSPAPPPAPEPERAAGEGRTEVASPDDLSTRRKERLAERIYAQHTELSPVVVGYPGEPEPQFLVWFHVGVQRFRVTGDYHNAEEAEWMRRCFAHAVAAAALNAEAPHAG